MSLKTRNVGVKMIRLQWAGTTQPVTHKSGVTVGIPVDPATSIVYLRISVDQKTIFSEVLNHFKWLDESCANGVATIDSKTVKIIIVYDSGDTASRDFFVEMERLLTSGSEKKAPEPALPSPPRSHLQPQTSNQRKPDYKEQATNDLLQIIQSGRSDDVVKAAEFLASSRTNIQFSLVDHNNNGESTIKKPEAKPSANVLKLTLHIECHLNKEPIIAPIHVCSGTNLRALKEQIEKETGVKRKDQYWYAFDRYIIPDEYEFGSSDPVVPPLKKNAPKGQVPPPSDPIRNGDTVIMYIARTPALEP